MEEHPDSNAVFLFNRMMESFVFHLPSSEGEELIITEAERGFSLDHRCGGRGSTWCGAESCAVSSVDQRSMCFGRWVGSGS
eukprot:1735757-Rhodomonas_salina.1